MCVSLINRSELHIHNLLKIDKFNILVYILTYVCITIYKAAIYTDLSIILMILCLFIGLMILGYN